MNPLVRELALRKEQRSGQLITEIEFFNPSAENVAGKYFGNILDETFDVFGDRINVPISYNQLYKITGRKVRDMVNIDRCIVDGRDLVRKRYYKNRLRSADITRIKRECYALLYFDHPSVLSAVAINEDERYLDIYTEYMWHGDLLDYIDYHRRRFNCEMPTESCMFIFRQILNGIMYIHNQGISHRDLKPENILVAEDCQIKICDFGYCIGFQENFIHKTPVGTKIYCSPEIVRGDNYDGPELDYWGLGCLLYVLSHSKIPFLISDNDDFTKIYDQMLAGPMLDKDIPVGIRMMIIGFLTVNKSNRLTVAECLTLPFMDYENLSRKTSYSNISNNSTPRMTSPRYDELKKASPRITIEPASDSSEKSGELMESQSEHDLDAMFEKVSSYSNQKKISVKIDEFLGKNVEEKSEEKSELSPRKMTFAQRIKNKLFHSQ